MKWLVFIVVAAGCSVGAGSAYVGQWKPRDQVEFEACLVDETGRCVDRKEVVTHVPGRKFWGTIIEFPALGAVQVDHGGVSNTQFRAEMGLEILKGFGRWAVGVRGSALVNAVTGMDASGMPKKGGAVSVPIDLIGHYALVDRLSVYGGVGASPFAQSDGEHAYVGGRGLAGLQFPLSKTHSENFIILSLEVDRMYIRFDQPYTATGFTGHIGLFF